MQELEKANFKGNQIRNSMGGTTKLISDLEVLVGKLEERLHDVIRSSRPEAEGEDKGSSDVPLVAELNDLNYRLSAAIRRITDIIDRCEL